MTNDNGNSDRFNERLSAAERVIRRDEVYEFRGFCSRLGLGRALFSKLRRQGLPVIRIGKKLFIDGAEAIDWLRDRDPAS